MPRDRLIQFSEQSIASGCLSLAPFRTPNARLSCGARAPQRLRHRPPARRQLQPVVRLHSSLLPLLTWPPADRVPPYDSVLSIEALPTRRPAPARSLRPLMTCNQPDSLCWFERCNVPPAACGSAIARADIATFAAKSDAAPRKLRPPHHSHPDRSPYAAARDQHAGARPLFTAGVKRSTAFNPNSPSLRSRC